MIATDLRLAFALLTRLPVGHAQGDVARAVWAYPVAGAVVGAIGAAADWLARRAGMAPPLAAIWTLAAMVLTTGGLHEDGLADTADGFGGGATPERKLAIMRDSRIGSYGAIALLLAFAMRGAAIAILTHPAPALIAVGALGRGAMILVLLALRPARAGGLAAPLATLRPRIAAAGLSIAVLAALLLPWRLAILAVALSALTSALLAWLARAQIGGYTGDVLGATEIATECVLLSALAAT